MNLLKEVISSIKPDEREVMREVGQFIKRLNSALRKSHIQARATAGGSIAKGTFLKGDYDCDVFVRFNLRKYSTQAISDILGKVLKKAFRKVERVHGSRDYFHIGSTDITGKAKGGAGKAAKAKKGGCIKDRFRYEIVPVLDIKKTDQAANVTDCSPLHVEWVNKFPKMKDEIRLTKAFMKAAGVYGAESYIKGFSGHVVDILTIYYKGFMPLLRAAQGWKQKEVIDYYNRHKGKALFNLNTSKTQSAIIVVDPIQPERNASAALSAEKMEAFRKKACEFLKRPSEGHFFPKKFDITDLKRMSEGKGRLIILDAEAKTGKEDVVGSKLLKALESIVDRLKEKDFKVIEHGWHWDKGKKAVFWILVKDEDLPEIEVRSGPPLNAVKHCSSFRSAHKKTFEKDGRLYAEVWRDFVRAEQLIEKVIDDDYIKGKVRKISIER